jgi:subtilisin family serine protease
VDVVKTAALILVHDQAIEHAVETWNVDIISMSFGLSPPATHPDANQDEQRKVLQDYEALVDDIQDAIRRASMAPRIMFAAASNSEKNQKRAFPARYDPWVICVHASDGNGNDGGINPPLQNGINFMTLGIGLELLERRWIIVGKTRRPVYKTAYKSGTSFATPIAAGVAATVLDLAARVSAINDRTKRKLRRCEEMKNVLELLSTSSGDAQYSFLAPWNLWERHWQSNEVKRRAIWDAINLLFDA